MVELLFFWDMKIIVISKNPPNCGFFDYLIVRSVYPTLLSLLLKKYPTIMIVVMANEIAKMAISPIPEDGATFKTR